MSADVVERLNLGWDEKWPKTSPDGPVLRTEHGDRWVRFHSLPESKRYADTEAEHAIVLERHHAVLDELGAGRDCFVLSLGHDRDRLARLLSDFHEPAPRLWGTMDTGEDQPDELYVCVLTHPSPALDAVLRTVADDVLGNVTIAPPDLRWLYHPYDGGGDVIAPSPSDRDRISKKFAEWRPRNPEGL